MLKIPTKFIHQFIKLNSADLDELVAHLDDDMIADVGVRIEHWPNQSFVDYRSYINGGKADPNTKEAFFDTLSTVADVASGRQHGADGSRGEVM